MRRLLRWLLGDWWRPDTDGMTWGIYHGTRWHSWNYGMSREAAQAECDRLNTYEII